MPSQLERRPALGRVSTPINVEPGVTTRTRARPRRGTLHDPRTGPHGADIVKDIGYDGHLKPGISVEQDRLDPGGQAPQDVTYTFTVHNDSVPPVPLDNVTVSDNLCPGVRDRYAGGDPTATTRCRPDRDVGLHLHDDSTRRGPVQQRRHGLRRARCSTARRDKVCDDAPSRGRSR